MSSRRRGSSQEPLKVSSEEPKFMKIITSQVGEDLKLQIPKDFLEKNGIKLSSHILLKVPNNIVWEMRFMEDKEEIWLHKEFIQFYSIQYGHLLIFEYNGNSDFNLVIFDMTASEIIYPSSPPKTDIIHQFSDEEDSVEILGSVHKVIENDEIKQKKDKFIKEEDVKTKSAMDRAKSLKSNNPIVVVTINSSYALSITNISNEFGKDNMMGSDGEMIKEVTLEIAGESLGGGGQKKQWKVKVYKRDRNKKKTRTCIFWRKFVQDNNVKFGDVCVLEYKKDVNVFVVHIFTEGL